MEQTQDMELMKHTPKIEYKTLFDKHIGQLDDEIMNYMNKGWMLHGSQYNINGIFYQVLIRVPHYFRDYITTIK
jgi:hypothetical protein